MPPIEGSLNTLAGEATLSANAGQRGPKINPKDMLT